MYGPAGSGAVVRGRPAAGGFCHTRPRINYAAALREGIYALPDDSYVLLDGFNGKRDDVNETRTSLYGTRNELNGKWDDFIEAPDDLSETQNYLNGGRDSLAPHAREKCAFNRDADDLQR